MNRRNRYDREPDQVNQVNEERARVNPGHTRRQFLLLGGGLGLTALIAACDKFPWSQPAPTPTPVPEGQKNYPPTAQPTAGPTLGPETPTLQPTALPTAKSEQAAACATPKPEVIAFRPELAPSTAPFLPTTEGQIQERYKVNPDQATWNRIPVFPSDGPQDHYRNLAGAAKAYADKKGWDSAMAYPGKWFYPMMIMGSNEDLRAGKGAQVMANGKMIDIDAIRVDNWAVAANVLSQGNPKMAVYEVPWVAGQLYARLPVGTTRSEFAVAYSVNQHYREVKAGADRNVVPAVIVEGNPNGPVNVYYGYPTDTNGNYALYGFERRIEPVGNTLTVFLPETGYKGDFSPFVIIQQQVIGAHPLAETEVFHRLGTDFKRGHAERVEGKNRIEEADVLQMIQKGSIRKIR